MRKALVAVSAALAFTLEGASAESHVFKDIVRCNENAACPEGFGCNEFHVCIKKQSEIYSEPCDPALKTQQCPAHQYCNEHGWCVDPPRSSDAPQKVKKCQKFEDCCPKEGGHCSEFGICVGCPEPCLAKEKQQAARCNSHVDCASDHHCNEFHFCIPGGHAEKTSFMAKVFAKLNKLLH